jgi:phosphoribosyl-ATP pyrophosphohydrolase/phosphoribosyl-AMP cyclohydrolase
MIRNLKFDDRGLLPTTVQDTRSHQILVQDFMNAESLALTVQSGTVWFYSASRNEVWCSRSSFGQVHCGGFYDSGLQSLWVVDRIAAGRFCNSR